VVNLGLLWNASIKKRTPRRLLARVDKTTDRSDPHPNFLWYQSAQAEYKKHDLGAGPKSVSIHNPLPGESSYKGLVFLTKSQEKRNP